MNASLSEPAAGQHHNIGIHRSEDVTIVDARIMAAEWCDLGGARPRHRTLRSKPNQVSPYWTFPAEGREGADLAAGVLDRSRDEDDDASSVMTSVTMELRLAATKTMIHAKAQRAVHASIPREVKEALLENAFPHVRTSGSVDSTMAERSIDTSKTEPITRSSSEQSEAAPESGSGDKVDYNDCIPTLSPREIAELRQALYNTEKDRVQYMMEHLSQQSETYRELLEEHHTLQQRVERAEREKKASEDKVCELEKSVVEMKLQLANAKGREDHHKLSVAQFEAELAAMREENDKLRRGVGTVPKKDRRNSDNLTKSLSTAETPDDNVRSGAPARRIAPLTRSWFSKEGLGFLDRSFRRANSKDSSHKEGLDVSFSDICQEREEVVPMQSPQANDDPPRPKKVERRSHRRSRSCGDPKMLSPIGSDIFLPYHHQRSADTHESSFSRVDSKDSSNKEGLDVSFLDTCPEQEEAVPMQSPQANNDPQREALTRSRSFVNPTKTRASNGSEFMPWGSPSAKKEVKVERRSHRRSRSYVDPKKLSPIGSDIFLPYHHQRSADDHVSRLTMLSNITDCTLEDGDDASALEEARREVERLFKQSLCADTPPPGGDSRESRSTPPAFEPAQPSDQLVLGLREVPRTEQPPYECTNQLVQAVGMERDEFEGRMRMATSSRGMDGGRPRLQKAASLRGRNKNKASSSGDAFFAFC